MSPTKLENQKVIANDVNDLDDVNRLKSVAMRLQCLGHR